MTHQADHEYPRGTVIHVVNRGFWRGFVVGACLAGAIFMLVCGCSQAPVPGGLEPVVVGVDPRTHARGELMAASTDSVKTTDSPLFNVTPRVPAPPIAAAPPGYHVQIVAWTDGGFDSTWTTKAPYQKPVTHRIELRPERAGVRYEYVPDDAPLRVFMFYADDRARFAGWNYRSAYRDVNGCNRFIAALERKDGAVQSYRFYPSAGERVTVQTTHPWSANLIEWCQP